MAINTPITAIPQIYRNIRRSTEIATILSKYGFVELVRRLRLDTLLPGWNKEPEPRNTENTGVRIRKALTELGPTFIKLGQFLSTRPDIIGVEIATELQELQANVKADDFEKIREIIEKELNGKIEDLFLAFDETPIASGSIGQAHLAKLPSGQQVVVKVQHPNIDSTIRTDLEILTALAQWAQQIDDFKNYQPSTLVSEWSRVLRTELNFRRETQRLRQFERLMQDEKQLKIPAAYPEYCSNRILTMERITGRSVRNIDAHSERKLDLNEVAKTGASIYLNMIFKHGLYHADPHGGNIFVLEDGRIALIDFGMVGRISQNLRENIEEMLLAIVNQDVPMLTTIIRHVGAVPSNVKRDALDNDLADFVSQYTTQSLDHFDVSGALNDIVTIIRRHQIILPAEVALLLKTLVSLEGTGRQLNPHFNLMEILVPLRRSMLLDRLSPQRYLRRGRRLMIEVEHLVDRLPERVSNILKLIQDGEINVQINHHRMGANINRLVMGMLTSALFLGSSILLSMKVPPLIFANEMWGIKDMSLMGLMGMIACILLGARLMWSIRVSGNLDQPSD